MNFEFNLLIFRFGGSEGKCLKKLFFSHTILFHYIDKVFGIKIDN